MTRQIPLLALALLFVAAASWAGQAASGGSLNRPGGGERTPAPPPAGSGAKPAGAGTSATTPALPSPLPTVPPNFPNRLGDNTGWRIQPSPGVLPGARGVNQPGSLPGAQPLPLTPQPAPADPRMHPFGGYRDINNPGGATGAFPGWAGSDGPGIVPWDPDGGRNSRRDGDRDKDQRHWPPHQYAPTYYLLPYYIPYVVNTQGSETLPGSTPAVASPNQPGGIAAQPLPQPGPYGSVTSSTGATSTSTSSLTLLVFKDHTIVLAKAYWLEGDTVWYETQDGTRAPISIAQIDLGLTQQLNKDRGIKFVLESR